MRMRIRQQSPTTGMTLTMAVVATIVSGLLGLLVVGLTGCSSPPTEPTESVDSILMSQASFQTAPISGWRSEYFAGSWQGNPLLVRNDAEIKFDWGSGPPAPEVPADDFSVRWTANPDLPAGLYRLTIWADNRVRMWVDHNLVINGWQDGPRRDFVTHVNLAQGAHPMKLEYYHAFGEASMSLDITYVQPLLAQPPAGGGGPVAVINGPVQALVGQPVTFSARDSSGAGGGGIVGLNWSFGDGATGEGVTITHAYMAPGSYIVTLVVADDRGLSSTAQHVIQVDASVSQPIATPPIAGGPLVPIISAPSQVSVGQPIRFDASSSQSPNPIVSYAWEFGDGTTANAISVEKIYSLPGTYNVILTLTDDQGLQASTNSAIQVVPEAVLPTVEPEPQPSLAPEVTPTPEAMPAPESQ